MDSPENSNNYEKIIIDNNQNEKLFGLEIQEFLDNKSTKISKTKTPTTFEKNNLLLGSINISPLDEKNELSIDFLTKNRNLYFKKLKNKINYLNRNSFNKVKFDLVIKFILHFIGNLINILSVIAYMLETYFENLKTPNSHRVLLYLQIIDISFCFYFVFECVISFTQVKRSGILRKIFSIDSFIDIVSILPSLIIFFMKIQSLNFLKILRVIRVVRILRLFKSLKLLKIKSENDQSERDHHLKFNPVKIQFFTILLILICVFFIGAGVVLALQDLVKDAWSVQGINFFDAIYFMIVTFSSAGYGDILPMHIISRFSIILGLFCLIIIVSDQISKMAALLSVWGNSMKKYDKIDHFILIANKTVNLKIFLAEIRKRDLAVDILILSKDITKLPNKNYPFDNVELATVLDYDLETLERANTKNAKAVFIFCHKTTRDCDQEEKINDFLALKLNRYFCDVPVYLETLYSEGSFSSVIKNPAISKSSQILTTVPIMRIKSLIISKASFIDGFTTFIQNLMLNHKELTDKKYNFSSLTSIYMEGCKDKIFIRKIPKFFEKKFFFDACHMMYFKSIHNYFVEINSFDTDYCPIIFIGLIDKSKIIIYKKEEILIFPSRKQIRIDYMEGIFMCNNKDHLDKVLQSFDHDINLIEKRRNSIFSNEIKSKGNFNSNMIKNFDTDNFSSESEEIEDVQNSLDDNNKNRLVNLEKEKGEDEFGLDKKRSLSESIISSHNKVILKMNDNKELDDEDYNSNEKEQSEKDKLSKVDFHQNDQIRVKRVSKKINENNFFNYNRRPSVDFKQVKISASSAQNFDIIKDTTNQNIKFMQEAEPTEEFDFKRTFDNVAFKRYGAFSYLDEGDRIQRIDSENFVENRIYDLEKQLVSFSKHIVIIGVQDGMKKLINLLTNHYPSTDICVISNRNVEDIQIFKLLKLFKNLNYLKGNSGNPHHILNAAVDKSKLCIFLTENLNLMADEDMGKIISYRSIEYFFNTKIILELWNKRSLRFLGNQPLHRNLNLTNEDFLHPMYMAGRLILLSHLDKIMVDKYYDPKVFEVWMSILTLGFASSSTNMGYQTLTQKNQDFPIMLTIDIPTQYVGKEYHVLVNDLLLLDNPAMCLGLYVLNPLEYLTCNSIGKVCKLSRKYTSLKITNSYKRKIINKGILDKLEQTYRSNMNIIREISYNDQVILDYVDVNKSHLPMFFTNPRPGFIIGENCKALIVNFFNHSRTINKMSGFKKKKENPSSEIFVKSSSMLALEEKHKLYNSQQIFYSYLDDLKYKAKKSYEASIKKIEIESQDSFSRITIKQNGNN